jgi:HSP20 family protein
MMSLRDAMDRLLHESFVLPGGGALAGGGSLAGGRQSLPLDVIENDDNYVIYAWMPGVKPEDVQIMVQGSTLTIRGETSYSTDQPQGQAQGQAQGQPQSQAQQGQMRGQQGQDQVRQGQNAQNAQNAQGTSAQSQQQQSSQLQPSQGQGQPQRGRQTGNWIIHERRHGTFYRAVSLPTPVNADAATTRFEHGELMITLPKAEEARPKQIRINGGRSSSGQIQQPQ